MVTMAACLLLLVGSFFWYVVTPAFNTSIDRVLEEYVRGFAATAPDVRSATRLGARLDLQVRYEGPAGEWSTATTLPRVGEVRRQTAWASMLHRRHYYIVAAPDGGSYLFAWNVPRAMWGAHTALLVLLLLLMTAVVLTTHKVLNRLLQPLRVLSEGVDRLGAGELNISLPRPSEDEFGRLTDAFNAMVGRVREMIASRDQLLLDVSHELRSPLTRMKVALELLPPNEQRERLTLDVAEMEQMISELLEMERIRAGHGVRLTRRNLVPILLEVAEPFRTRPPGVHVIPTSGEILADVDEERFRTVVRNLLENATKYSVPHSDLVELSAVENSDTVVVRVTDHGPGVPEDDRERVFEPFFRLDRSRTKSTGGYGLGLSICKRVMEAHGGSIAVDSGAGRGASFVLTFPKRDPMERGLEQPKAGAERGISAAQGPA